MLQLACILNMVSVWKRATVRVFLCTDTADATENERRKSRLDELLNQLRIQASTQLIQIEPVKNLLNRPVINEQDLPHYQQSFYTNAEILAASDIYLKAANQLIRQYSEQSAICFLYMPPPPANRLHKNQQLNSTLNSNGSNGGNESFTSTTAVVNTIDHSMSNGGVTTLAMDDHSHHIAQQQTTAFISTTSQDSSNENNKRYMKILETLSDSLTSCAFVNGVSCVTSTHL